MKKILLKSFLGVFWALGAMTLIQLSQSSRAQALELDWSGQFRSEFNYFHYSPDNTSAGATTDATKVAAGGYYIPGGGAQDALFQTLFMRLKPRVVVNDNIYLKTELWLGDPLFGFFGSAIPFSQDQRYFYSTQSRGAIVSAQRFWAEFVTEIGTFQVGRAPLHWGLGIVWNSGDNSWDRYLSTGDQIRWTAKFGAFTFSPAVVVYSMGTSVGNINGSSADFAASLKYDNKDDAIEGGLNVIKRVTGGSQGTYGIINPSLGTTASPGFSNYLLWDLYGRKGLGPFAFAAEVPIVTGSMTQGSYSAFAVATEASMKWNDTFFSKLKIGFAPGQSNATTQSLASFNAFYFHPGYSMGNIMFNYKPSNFAGVHSQNDPSANPDNMVSIYDAPVVNAFYISATQDYRLDKWTFTGAALYALAAQTATAGQFFYNYWTRSMPGVAQKSQGASMGFEIDLGTRFQWDENLEFKVDLGLFLPGSFYAFSNQLATDNPTNALFSGSARVAVSF